MDVDVRCPSRAATDGARTSDGRNTGGEKAHHLLHTKYHKRDVYHFEG